MTTVQVAKASSEIEDPIERASYIASKLDAVPKPGELVRSWFEASLAKPGRRDITAETAVAWAYERATNSKFLDALGRELSRRNYANEAIEVFRMAIAAGSKTDTTEMLLGYLLLRQNNEEGIPLLERALAGFAEWGLPREMLGRYYARRDPARTLALLSTPADGKEHELRAMAFETLGRTQDAAREARSAIASYDSEIQARQALADWHTSHDVHDRALVHARALFGLLDQKPLLGGDFVDEVDEAIVAAFSEGNALGELVPWLRERTDPFPLRVAWHVFFGLKALHPNPAPEIAMRAARDIVAYYTKLGDPSEARVWQVREAGVAAKHGDTAPLAALVDSGLADDAAAWVEVANCYMSSDDHDAASAAADRAMLLDPSSGGALVLMCRLAMALGDADMLHRVSLALLAHKPAWHEGPEFLARSFARRLDTTAALMHSQRTLEMAAYCHNAWLARTEALVIANDLVEARRCIARSLEIRAGEPGDDALILEAALAGNAEKLEAELAHGFRHLPAPPFPDYVARLREIASAPA